MLRNIRKHIFRLILTLYRRIKEARWQEWERGIKDQFYHCGDSVTLGEESSISNPQEMSVGNYVHIGSHAWIQASGGLEIGENTIISRYCTIITRNHNYEGNSLPYGEDYIEKPIQIGRNVWIGTNVMIVPGVTIGDGAIIGMGTVVVKDVPPFAIIGGSGQRILGYRDKSHYKTLDQQGLYYKKVDKHG